MSPSLLDLFSKRLAVLAVVLFGATHADSETYRVMHKFTGPHAYNPSSGLVSDGQGNLYGTTAWGGFYGGAGGAVYRLSSNGTFSIVHGFSGPDGLSPRGDLVMDSAGNLYGTTTAGGTSKQCQNGCGTVFELTPSTDDNDWTESVLYSFCSESECSDGANPTTGVILDSLGNLYGTTLQGGVGGVNNACGTVFELTPNEAGGWTETVLLAFNPGLQGCSPESGLTIDGSGNLYGTLYDSACQVCGGIGMVFELSPQAAGWAYSQVYGFSPAPGSEDGKGPFAGLTFDQEGNLYGTTVGGGKFDGGTVYKLSPTPQGAWSETILHNFAGESDGQSPQGQTCL